MNIINSLRLKSQYSELVELNIDNNVLEKAMNDKMFSKAYKNSIKTFIKYLQGCYLSNDKISFHINNILNPFDYNNCLKYISFVEQNGLISINNPQVIYDDNFNDIFNTIHSEIFADNIAEIIEHGYSERLLQFINKYPYIVTQKLTPDIFKDNAWNIMINNPKIGDKDLFDLFNGNLNIIANILNSGFYEGFKYTYENIPEIEYFSPDVYKHSIEQFDMEFIKDIGNSILSKLYKKHCFTNEDEFSKIFKIYKAGNGELIKDIVNFNPERFSFKQIPDDSVDKDILNQNIDGYIKTEVLLYKYFGIRESENHYIKLFLHSINQIELTKDFQDTYGTILQLLNRIYQASDEEIIEISKGLNIDNKEKFKKLIYDCEKYGNELIKVNFVEELEKRNKQLMNTVPHETEPTKSGKLINIYKLKGQPFTLLVHAISHNNLSENNKMGDLIIKNPENWNSNDMANNHISASLISEKNMQTYGTELLYGFFKLPAYSLKLTSHKDVGINRNASLETDYNMRNRSGISDINTVVTVDELIQRSIDYNSNNPFGIKYNEVVLSRTDEKNGEKFQPDFIVCFDGVDENSKKAAEHFGIPIYVIYRKYYDNLKLDTNKDLDDSFNNKSMHK